MAINFRRVAYVQDPPLFRTLYDFDRFLSVFKILLSGGVRDSAAAHLQNFPQISQNY